MSTTITITGNVTSDPTFRVTQSGDAVCDFRVAVTDRRLNAKTGEWEDGPTEWFKVTAWKGLAENALESVVKGTRVTVTGTPRAEGWVARETGEVMAGISVTARDIALSILFHAATSSRPHRATQDDQPENVVELRS